MSGAEARSGPRVPGHRSAVRGERTEGSMTESGPATTETAGAVQGLEPGAGHAWRFRGGVLCGRNLIYECTACGRLSEVREFEPLPRDRCQTRTRRQSRDPAPQARRAKAGRSTGTRPLALG